MMQLLLQCYIYRFKKFNYSIDEPLMLIINNSAVHRAIIICEI